MNSYVSNNGDLYCDLSINSQKNLIEIDVDLSKHVKPIETKPEEVKHVELKALPAVPFTTLTAYSYYESGKKYVKALITLEGVEKHPADKIKVEFKNRSFEIVVYDMKGKNYIFKVPKLQCKIQPAQSTFAFKKDTVVVTLCKEKEEDHWWSLFKSKAVCEVDSD